MSLSTVPQWVTGYYTDGLEFDGSNDFLDGGNAEVEWTMAAGTYTLDVAYREEGALVDAIVIEKIVLPPPPTEELWIEAEDDSPIGALLQVVDDAAASVRGTC